MNPTSMIIAAILAAIGVFALIIIVLLLRRLPRYKREKRRLYGGVSTETLVQAQPYDYVPPDDPVNRRSKYSDQDHPNVPVAAFLGSPVSVHPPSTLRKSPAMGGSDHSDTSLPYLAKGTGRYRSTTVASRSSIGSIYSVNSGERSPVPNFTPPVHVPEAPARPAPARPVSVRPVSVGPASIRPSVRPLSIAGRPGTIRPTIPDSPFDSRRVCSFYPTQPTIREYSKRDTIFGKRSIDERGRVDLLADDVPGTAPAHQTEFSSPRPAPHPPMNRSYPLPPQSGPDHNGPPRLTLNTTMLSSITEPTLSIESSPSISTMRFATRPNSGVTQLPSTTPSRSNSNGESLFSPSERDKRSSMGSKSQRERRRSSRIPSVPPLPSLPEPEPEPEPEPVALMPLAPPPPVTRHQRAAGSLGSMISISGVAIRAPNSTMFNSPVIKNKPFLGAGLPSSPRPVRALSPQQSSSQSPQLLPFALGMNSSASPRSSGMRMVDLEAGVVGITEERRGWAKVRSMMGVVGDTNKDESLFELVAGTPPLPSPAPGQGTGWRGQKQGGQKQRQGRLLGPHEALPGKVGGPRVLKKPAPLALGALSNFEPPVYGNATGVRKRFVREDVVLTAKTGTPPAADSSPGQKKMSILQSAVINGRANKEEVELVTGMKMDI